MHEATAIQDLYCCSRFPFGSVNNTAVREKMDCWITDVLCLVLKYCNQQQWSYYDTSDLPHHRRRKDRLSHTKTESVTSHSLQVRGWRPPSYILSWVIVRIVRLVSFCPPEAELCSCDPPVHLFNVLTLGLKVVCGVIWAGHKYLEETQEVDEDCTTKLIGFFFRKHHYLALLSIIIGY